MYFSQARFDEYVMRLQLAERTGNADKEKLIALVSVAQGARSMRKFASDMGVNVAYLSRIKNGMIPSLSNSMLAKIAIFSDPNSGITIEKLMEAQGIVERQDSRDLGNRYEEDCRRIVADVLLKRGFTLSYSEVTWRSKISDFELITDAIQSGDCRWIFGTKMMTGQSRFSVGADSAYMWLDSAMAAYYRGEKAGRISLIINNKDVFEELKDRLAQYKIRDEISVILISVEQGKVIDEYVAPLSDGRIPVYPLMDAELAEIRNDKKNRRD